MTKIFKPHLHINIYRFHSHLLYHTFCLLQAAFYEPTVWGNMEDVVKLFLKRCQASTCVVSKLLHLQITFVIVVHKLLYARFPRRCEIK